MKLFIKGNKITILVIILLIIWFSFGIGTYIKEYGYEARLKMVDVTIDKCNDLDYESDAFLKKVCVDAVNIKNNPQRNEIMDDTLTAFYVILTSPQMFYISLIMPLLLMISAIEKFHKKLKNGFIKNELSRMKYSKVLNNNFLEAYKKIFLFIGILLIVLFISYLISGHFVYHENVNCYEENLWIYKSYPLYLIIYFINIALHYVFCMNIALCICKKNKNVFLTIIISFLIWLTLDILTEVILTVYVLPDIFNVYLNIDSFNLFAIYAWRIKDGNLLPFYFSIVLFALSFLWLFITYRKKESVVIASER